jgi:hypothetical protein
LRHNPCVLSRHDRARFFQAQQQNVIFIADNWSEEFVIPKPEALTGRLAVSTIPKQEFQEWARWGIFSIRQGLYISLYMHLLRTDRGKNAVFYILKAVKVDLRMPNFNAKKFPATSHFLWLKTTLGLWESNK